MSKNFLEFSDQEIYEKVSKYFRNNQEKFIENIESDTEYVDLNNIIDEVIYLMEYNLSELEDFSVNFDPKSTDHLKKCERIAQLLKEEYEKDLKPTILAVSLFSKICDKNQAFFDFFNHENPERWASEFEYVNFFIDYIKKECVIVDPFEIKKRKKLQEKIGNKHKEYFIAQNEIEKSDHYEEIHFINHYLLTNTIPDLNSFQIDLDIHDNFEEDDLKIITTTLKNMDEEDLENILQEYNEAFESFLGCEQEEKISELFKSANVFNDNDLFDDFSYFIHPYSDQSIIEPFAYKMQYSYFNDDEKRCNYIKQNLRKMIDDNYRNFNKEL